FVSVLPLTAPYLTIHSRPTRRSSDLRLPRSKITSPTRSRRTLTDMPDLCICPVCRRHRARATRSRRTPHAGLDRPAHQLGSPARSEEHTSVLQSRFDLVCRRLLEKKT